MVKRRKQGSPIPCATDLPESVEKIWTVAGERPVAKRLRRTSLAIQDQESTLNAMGQAPAPPQSAPIPPSPVRSNLGQNDTVMYEVDLSSIKPPKVCEVIVKFPKYIYLNHTQTPNTYLLKFERRKADWVNILLEQYAKPFNSACTTCGDGPASFRCLSCHSLGILCRGCMRDAHWHDPYHRVEQWNGSFFQRAGLLQVGLRLVIRNRAGCDCIDS